MFPSHLTPERYLQEVEGPTHLPQQGQAFLYLTLALTCFPRVCLAKFSPFFCPHKGTFACVLGEPDNDLPFLLWVLFLCIHLVSVPTAPR